MKKSLLGSLRESCRSQRGNSLRESTHSIKEMFGDNGELITLYGQAISEFGKLKEDLQNKRNSIFEKFAGENGTTPSDPTQKAIFEAFISYFDGAYELLNVAETKLKPQNIGLEPIPDPPASVTQPQE